MTTATEQNPQQPTQGGQTAVGNRSGTWQRWVTLLAHREPGDSLALFRIGCGLCVVGAVGAVVTAGAVPTLWFDAPHGGYLATLDAPWQFTFLGGATPFNVWIMVVLAMISGLCLALGVGGRLTALVALQSYMALADLNVDAGGSYDNMLTNALWLLFLSRATATLSLDCRLRTGKWTSRKLVPAWPRYLVIFQLVLIYWSTGMHKLSASWMPGGGFSAVYYTLQQPTWQRWDMQWLAWVYPLTQVATAVTWLWEITSPLLLLALWYRATRERPGRLRAFFNWINYPRWFVLIGVIMHAAVLVFMEVGPFSWIAFAYYACLLRPRGLASACPGQPAVNQ